MSLKRIDKLKAWMKEKNIETLFVDDPVDLRYLTGLTFSLGRLLVSSKITALFVDGRYIDIARAKAPCEAHLAAELTKHLSPRMEVAFDSAFISYDGFLELQKTYPEQIFVPVSKPLKTLRVIKDPEEINALKKAARLTREGYQHIVGLLKEGVTEEELSLEFAIYCRRHGASGLSFEPIIAFGANSAYPHHRAGKERLKKNQIVLFDLGAIVDGYAGDMTRVQFFGKPEAQLLKDYELIQEVQKKVIAHVAPNVRFGELDLIARQRLDASLFTHGLSHGIGLDVHEYPRLKVTRGDNDLLLQVGMAFTVEPGIYRKGLGGVRYEDVVVVTEDGSETL